MSCWNLSIQKGVLTLLECKERIYISSGELVSIDRHIIQHCDRLVPCESSVKNSGVDNLLWYDVVVNFGDPVLLKIRRYTQSFWKRAQCRNQINSQSCCGLRNWYIYVSVQDKRGPIIGPLIRISELLVPIARLTPTRLLENLRVQNIL